jgi:hypothetical protein
VQGPPLLLFDLNVDQCQAILVKTLDLLPILYTDRLSSVSRSNLKVLLDTYFQDDAYQAIHGENENKSFFCSFSVNEMRMKSDSWIGVLRQIRKGDDIP